MDIGNVDMISDGKESEMICVTSSFFWTTMVSSSTRSVSAPASPAANSNDTLSTGIYSEDPYAGGDTGIYSSSEEKVTDPDADPL